MANTNDFKQEENSLRGIADVIGEKLEDSFGHKMGFALLVFEFGAAPHIGNYISNAERQSMVKALRETADRLELGQDIPKNDWFCLVKGGARTCFLLKKIKMEILRFILNFM